MTMDDETLYAGAKGGGKDGLSVTAQMLRLVELIADIRKCEVVHETAPGNMPCIWCEAYRILRGHDEPGMDPTETSSVFDLLLPTERKAIEKRFRALYEDDVAATERYLEFQRRLVRAFLGFDSSED